MTLQSLQISLAQALIDLEERLRNEPPNTPSPYLEDAIVCVRDAIDALAKERDRQHMAWKA